MRIALIHPKISYECETPELEKYTNQWYRDIFSRAFNLNLLRLAALTPEEHEVVLIDENRREIPFADSFDLVAVTAMTYQADRAYEIAQKFKEQQVPTIFGGIHATMLPKEAAQYFDAVCIGEVENVWKHCLNDVAHGRLQPVYRGEFVDLDQIPPPNFDLVRELLPAGEDPGLCFFPMMTTRGCPRGCDYCSATYLFKKLYRKKSITNVLAELRQIKRIVRELNLKQFHVEFGDDNFIIDRKRTKELLIKLCDEDISYTASLDIAAADDPEMLELLRESGCKFVSIGLESLEEDILGELGQWKRAQRRKAEKNIEAFFRHGITPACNFIVGSDHTSLETFRDIRQFLTRYPVLFNILMFTPFPGTPYAKNLQAAGRLRQECRWAHYNLFNLVFEPLQISREAFYEAFTQLRLDFDHLSQYHRCMEFTVAQSQRKNVGLASTANVY